MCKQWQWPTMDDGKENVQACSVRQNTLDVYIFRCVILTILAVLITLSFFGMFMRWEELQLVKNELKRGTWTVEALL